MPSLAFLGSVTELGTMVIAFWREDLTRLRNFTCAEVMIDLPDGQLFWVIYNVSQATAMPVHKIALMV